MSADDTHASKDKYIVRFPDGMRDRLKVVAAENNRSLNAEIILRLQSYPNPEGGDMAKGNSLTIRISDETKALLDRLSKRGPYRLSMTSIVERGIELAARELGTAEHEAFSLNLTPATFDHNIADPVDAARAERSKP